ncbi:MAG: hypothetical protein CL561_00380 [Alphaproteobacteria bacterium]|nr:hypothetical protein [Alphaproteobacteria bacterium]|tara:strand:+ start:23664 stop:24785 length:1122 start_codon:yes stop_codon:yes gene_type:complete
MTVSNSVFRNEHAGTGEAVIFDYDFKIFEEGDLQVYRYDAQGNENLLVYNVDYTITNIGESGGGKVNHPIDGSAYSTLAATEKLFIVPNYKSTQSTVLKNQGGMYPQVIENALDKLTGLVKTLEEKISRTVLIDHLNGISANDVVDFIKNMASNLAATVTYKDQAAASASAASASADLSDQYANEAEDVEVTTGKYSAYHWAQKAMEAVLGIANVVEDETPQLGGNLDVNGHKIISADDGNIVLEPDGTGEVVSKSHINMGANKTLRMGVNAIGSIGGGAREIDLDLGRTVTATIDTSATTFTFSNPLPTGSADAFDLILTNGGSQTITWPATVDWVSGTAPTLTASGVDHIVFTTVDGGTNWNGYVAGLDLK